MVAAIARLLVSSMALVALPVHGQDPIPKFEQYVTDRAGLLSAHTTQPLEALLREFEARKGSRIAALIVPSTQPESIERFAQRAAEQWIPGSGAILVIAVNERAVRVEIGPKRMMTDQAARVVEADIVAPSIRAGDADTGVDFGLRTMMDVIDRGPGVWLGTFTATTAPASPDDSTRGRNIAFLVMAVALVAGLVGWWMWKRRPAYAEAGQSAPGVPGALTWYSPSSLMIIAVNLLPLWGVFFQGWSIFVLFVLFWLENVVLILTNALRILFANPGDSGLWLQKPFLMLGNCFQYGFFAAAHITGIFMVFAENDFERFNPISWKQNPIEEGLRVIEALALDIWQVFAMMVAAHVLVFCVYYIFRGEYRNVDIEELMDKPLGRLLLLHVTLILGGAATMGLGSPVGGMLILIALKIGGELLTHLGLVTQVRSPS